MTPWEYANTKFLWFFFFFFWKGLNEKCVIISGTLLGYIREYSLIHLLMLDYCTWVSTAEARPLTSSQASLTNINALITCSSSEGLSAPPHLPNPHSVVALLSINPRSPTKVPPTMHAGHPVSAWMCSGSEKGPEKEAQITHESLARILPLEERLGRALTSATSSYLSSRPLPPPQ